MRNGIKYVGTFVCLFFLAISSGQDCASLNGKWENETGSVLMIDSVGPAGHLAGQYVSSDAVDGKGFPAIGWVNQYGSKSGGPVSLSFTVRWEGYGSITAWTGTCDTDELGPVIRTMWHLVRPNTEFAWERIITNSSAFRPLLKQD